MKTYSSSNTSKRPRYDAVAEHYDGVMRPLEHWLIAKLRARVFSELPVDGRLLEVGSGTGANFPFYPNGARVAASEFSSRMIEVARLKRHESTVYFVQNCGEQLPFADDSFDAAVVTLVLCSVASPKDVFVELRRVVRGGGTIALLEHVRPNGLLGYFFDALNILTVAFFDDHFNRRTADDARAGGLKVINVERHALGIVNVIVCRA